MPMTQKVTVWDNELTLSQLSFDQVEQIFADNDTIQKLRNAGDIGWMRQWKENRIKNVLWSINNSHSYPTEDNPMGSDTSPWDRKRLLAHRPWDEANVEIERLWYIVVSDLCKLITRPTEGETQAVTEISNPTGIAS